MLLKLRLLVKVVTVLLAAILISESSIAGEASVEVELVQEGDFIGDVWSGRGWPKLKSGRLLGDNRDVLVVDKSTNFEIIQFNEGRWITALEVSDAAPMAPGEDHFRPWTVGDLDDDGLDEIIYSTGKGVARYEWDDEQMTPMLYDFPHEIRDLTTGDVNNDGKCDLVMFVPDDRSSPPDISYLLYVCQVQASGIDILWSGDENLTFYGGDIVPADRLGFIADFENNGRNQLVVMLSQSDVSCTRYQLLSWNGSGLQKDYIFQIAGGQLILDNYTSQSTPFSVRGLRPLDIEGKTLFYDSWYYPATDVILRRNGDQIHYTELVSEPDEHGRKSIGSPTFWMSLDGTGQGLLSFQGRGETFRFYRVRLVE